MAANILLWEFFFLNDIPVIKVVAVVVVDSSEGKNLFLKKNLTLTEDFI